MTTNLSARIYAAFFPSWRIFITMDIAFDNTYAKLPGRFYFKQEAAKVPAPAIIRVNDSLAKDLSLRPEDLNSDDGLAFLSGNSTPEGAEPLAQAYAGHQFGNFSPQLGDGRALLVGELLDCSGKRFDLQLKGSGQTPFSRSGDGKSALGPVLREYIVSEAMAALGVPTTRALAAVSTGEAVHRQNGPEPGGIFTRVAASHIRVGTFQYFYARNDEEALRILADYTMERHYPDASDPLELLRAVISAQASLVAHWMSLGFIHGVMNTDNCAVSGETIDFGPCAFMDRFHPQCVFSSIDRNARYAWGNQASIAHWNLMRFAETLLPLIDPDTEKAITLAEAELKNFGSLFQAHYHRRFSHKLGLPESAPKEAIESCLKLLTEQEIDFTLFFRRLTQVANGRSEEELASLFSNKDAFKTWFSEWNPSTEILPKMQNANPILIPRNHRVEQAIQSGYQEDFTSFHRLVDALQHPFAEQDEYADLESPPRPEEVIHETFCGT